MTDRRFLDWTDAAAADPRAQGKDGKSNLQHVHGDCPLGLDRTAPVDLLPRRRLKKR